MTCFWKLWLTGSEWHCTLWKAVSSHLFYDQQEVRDIAHFVKTSLLISFPMMNREWVTLHILWRQSFPMANSLWVMIHILWKAVSSYLFQWPTASEWHCTFCGRQPHRSLWLTGSERHCTFCERQSHHIFSYDQQYASNITHFVKASLVNFLLITKQGVSDIEHFAKAVSSHLFLWPTASEWCCTFCERHAHHIFSHDQIGSE